MKRITIRVPNWVKTEMERRGDVNWSQRVRDELIKYLKKEDVPIELRNLIRGYKNNKNWDGLTTLFLYAVIYEKTGQPLKTNLSIMFGDRAKTIETDMEAVFTELGIKDRYDKVFQERNFCDILLDTLFEEGIIDDLEENVIRTFENVEDKGPIAKALWLLGLYLDVESDNTFTCFEDMEMEILFSHAFENPDQIIQELNKLGVIYYDYYESSAYTHKNRSIPIYAYKLIYDIQRNPYEYSLSDYGDFKGTIEKILSEKRNREFLKWLKKDFDKNFCDDTTVQAFKKQFDPKYGENVFEDTLHELVNRGLLICRYWPHRRRAGQRSSMPAHTFYNLSGLGKKYLSEIAFEQSIKGAENKGDLESLIELYEKSKA
jgi:transcriptional regulator of met regulon